MNNTANNVSAQFMSSPPPILVWDGQERWQEPRFEIRYFHRKRLDVWSGYVQTKQIIGWVENIRIEVFVEKWKRDHAGATPTNDDILDWMLRDPNKLSDETAEFQLTELAENIVRNGVRQPIVITSEGQLLDGNRRYFAALLKLREAERSGDHATLKMVTQLPAYVLSPQCQKEDFEYVLVEENFVDECKIRWPNYIKARKVHDAFADMQSRGVEKREAYQQLAERFGLKRAQVERFIRMMDYIAEFHDHHATDDEDGGRRSKDEFEIKWREQRYFEYFDELTKPRVLNVLRADPELRDKVFEHLYDGDFANFAQIRKLPEIQADRIARDKFILGIGQQAVLDALEWVGITGVARKALSNTDRIMNFKRFLDSLTVQEISSLDPVAVTELQEIAQRVARMATSIQVGAKA